MCMLVTGVCMYSYKLMQSHHLANEKIRNHQESKLPSGHEQLQFVAA